jgi:hypothetical protein
MDGSFLGGNVVGVGAGHVTSFVFSECFQKTIPKQTKHPSKTQFIKLPQFICLVFYKTSTVIYQVPHYLLYRVRTIAYCVLLDLSLSRISRERKISPLLWEEFKSAKPLNGGRFLE